MAGLLYGRRTQSPSWKYFKRKSPLSLLFDYRARRQQKRRRALHSEWLSDLKASLAVKVPCKGAFIRLGNLADGGYVILDDGECYDTLLSYGVRDDVSFELDFVIRFPLTTVHLFDHSIDDLPIKHPLFTFHREGLGDRAFTDLDTLKSHMLKYGSGSKQFFLKIDIEGAEYESLLVVQDELWMSIGQIAIELHNVAPYNQHVIPLLKKLERHFTVIHVHGNNAGGTTDVDGIPIPSVIEITLLRNRAGVELVSSKESFPRPLDRPNDPSIPELSLEFLRAQ